MAAHVPMDHPCGECAHCADGNWTLESHPVSFKIVSNSHTDGINFKAKEFTANQIADAFENLIPGYMDWQIKKNALERWNALLSGLLEGPKWRVSAFDLQPVYLLFDDLFFLRALQHSCAVEWVDDIPQVRGPPRIGWSVTQGNIRGPTLRIRLMQPSPERPQSVQIVLCVLLHEMCHALLYMACDCNVCGCQLNMMNGCGITGHGPSWQRVRAATQETANLHLKGFPEPFWLAHSSEPDVRLEAEAWVKLLEGLYEKVTKEDSEVGREKRVKRNKKRAMDTKNTLENDKKKRQTMMRLWRAWWPCSRDWRGRKARAGGWKMCSRRQRRVISRRLSTIC